MALDVYAMCPCGSGKKLKFCCIELADEIDLVSRMLENSQLHAAEQRLDQLARKHPENPWAVVTHAMIQLELNEPAAARDGLKPALTKLADNELVILLYATASFHADGYDASKSAIHRAFQKCAKKHPQMVAALADAVAASMLSNGKPLAAREHLVLAMRLAPEKDRQEIFVQLLRFDGSETEPYFLRGMHPLPAFEGSEDEQKDHRLAVRYGSVGCWDAAADLLTKLAEAAPDKATRWHAVGLARAFDGDEIRAAQALHRAAEIYADIGLAVECKTLAIQLDLNHSENTIDLIAHSVALTSVSRVLTSLDQESRLVRMNVPPARDPDEVVPVAVYELLDRPSPPVARNSVLTTENVPALQAQVSVYDGTADSKVPARLVFAGYASRGLSEARDLLQAILGQDAQWNDFAEEQIQSNPAELELLVRRWGTLPGVANGIRRQFELDEWQTRLDQLVSIQPFAALGGRTLQDAAKDASARVAVLAMVNVLDGFFALNRNSLDVAALLERLGVEPLPPLTVTESESLNNLSVLQLHRLPIKDLTDEQLLSVVNRSLLVHHDRRLYEVLVEALARGSEKISLDLGRTYQTLSELCRLQNRSEDAIHWINEARQKLTVGPDAFQMQWGCDLRELLVRLDTPDDHDLRPLLKRIASYYGPKIPYLRTMLEQLLESAGIESPWADGSLSVSNESGTLTAGGVWTPGATPEPAAAAGGGKLWLPGQ